MRYDVYIERAREPGRERQVAEAVGAAFGLPADKLAARIRAGRVRVKSGADEELARRLVQKLDEMGAVCSVVKAEDAAQPDAGAAGAPGPDVGKTAGRPRPPPPPPQPRAPEPGAPRGLDLGSLGSAAASGKLSLAAVDGSADDAAAAREKSSARAGQPPPDPFAPPEMQAPPPELELAGGAAAPEAGAPAPESEPPGTADAPAASAPPPPVAAAAGARLRWQDQLRSRLAGVLESSRGHFAAGVVAAALAGFLAASAIGSIREGGYADSLERVRAASADVVDGASWRELERVRSEELEAMRGLRAGILATAGIAWLLVGGGAALLWFRVVDWPSVTRRLRP